MNRGGPIVLARAAATTTGPSSARWAIWGSPPSGSFITCLALAPAMISESPDIKNPLGLINKFNSHNLQHFCLALLWPHHVLGHPLLSHLPFRSNLPKPVSSHDGKGLVDLVIMVYFKDTYPKFHTGRKDVPVHRKHEHCRPR